MTKKGLVETCSVAYDMFYGKKIRYPSHGLLQEADSDMIQAAQLRIRSARQEAEVAHKI